MAEDSLEIVNEAFAQLGLQEITSSDFANGTTDRGKLANKFYDKCRKYVLKQHPWKFATKYATLYAYTTPTTTIDPAAGATTVDTEDVEFTAGVALFDEDTDIGKQIVGINGVAGRATITAVTSATVVECTIDEAFADADAIDSGSWRLYGAEPDHTFGFTIDLPSDWVRFKDVASTDTTVYKLIADSRVVCEVDEVDIVYISDIEDTTKFDSMFEETLVAYLAQKMAWPATQQMNTLKAMTELYKMKLAEARSLDSQQGVPDDVGSDVLNRVRNRGGYGPDRFWNRL
jgi:hypothetical protein